MTSLSAGKPPVPPAPLPRPPAAPRRLRLSRGDHEFLPAALEILETPLSPVRTSMILTICAFVTAALAWSYFGRVDIIATAQGKIQPVGRTKTVQPLETGKVLSVAVENGARVKAGDVLVRLDPAEARADEATLQANMQSERAEVKRRAVALALAAARTTAAVPKVSFPADTSPALAAREQRVLADDIAQLAGQVGSLDGQAREKKAERDRLSATIEAQQSLVATLKERVDMRQALEASRSESRAKVIDALELMQTQQATLASERGQIGEIDANLARLGRDIDKSYAAFSAENAQKLSDTERLLDENTEKLAKAQLKTARMTLTSPIAGTVVGSMLTTVGQVVTVGEQLMQIVPEDTKLEIECYLPNADIGFVRKDQQAVIKIESFPFTDYGTLDADVVRVAHDAIPQPDADQREQNPAAASRDNGLFGGGQRFQNLVYPVTLAMSRTTMRSDGEDVPLVAGMAVTVEIKTGTRRILSYLFSPIVQVATTALRER